MRRGLLGVVAAASLCAAAPAAAAGVRDQSTVARLSGTLTATWHGDEARGCAAAGVCAYSGSAVLPLSGGEAQIDFFGGLATGDVFGVGFPTSPIVVRVRRTVPDGGRPGACLDAVAAGVLPFSIEPAGGRRIRIGLGGPEQTAQNEAQGLSSGHCAGPRPVDLAGSLPSAVVDLAHLTRNGSVVDFSGRNAFTAGAFSGNVISTAKLTVGGGNSQGGASTVTDTIGPTGRSRSVPTRTIRVLVIRLAYRIRPTAGSFVTQLAGVGDRSCRLLDVCGATGSLVYAFTTRGGILELSGGARLRGPAPRDLRGALDYVAHHGAFNGYGSIRPHTGQTAARFGIGDLTCAETVAATAPPIGASGRNGRIFVRFAPPDEQFTDQLRTRCPGPTQADVLGHSSLATAAISPPALAAPRLRIVLRGGRAFSSNAFSGSYAGGAVLEMRRVRAKVGTAHLRVPVRRRRR